jgi:hypothetical protein
MNQDQCNELRDILFAERFPSRQRLYRYMAVIPGTERGVDAVLHYAYAPGVWEREGWKMGPDNFLKYLIDKTAYRAANIKVRFHDYLQDGWSMPWTLTAKDSSDNFPLLIAVERADGSITGAVMRDPHMTTTEPRVAGSWCEPQEVEELIALVRGLEVDDQLLSTYKERNLDAASLASAIAQMPETEAGQNHVLLYRGNEWFSGLWTNPEKSRRHGEGLDLHSVADFHGVRVSRAKFASRAGLSTAREKQTLVGDYAVLKQALERIHEGTGRDYERNAAVLHLCGWWNTHAPEDMRSAGLFRVYHWVGADNTFTAGDPEEPAVQADQMAQCPTYALFEEEGHPTVAVQFFRGRSFNTEGPYGVQTYHPNGDEAWQIGCELHEVDEAYYSIAGLKSLKTIPTLAVSQGGWDEDEYIKVY